MIDFRYHLVSIVAIFIALAVGIVLGAGPLQRQLGETLTAQVAQLRQEKSDLRGQLDVTRRRNEAADTFASQVTDDVVRSRLAGRSVAVIQLPGAESSVVDKLVKTLTSSGAKITGQVRLQRSWADPKPGQVAFRERIAQTLSPRVGLSGTSDQTVDQRMAAVLAKAITRSSGPPTGGNPAVTEAARITQGSQAVNGLQDAGLISVVGDALALAPLVVFVAGEPDREASETVRGAVLDTWLATVRGVDDAGDGVVVAGPIESTESAGVLGAVRGAGDISDAVSTVDDVGLGTARVSVVFALVEQEVGKAGKYGSGAGADGVLPVIGAVTP